MKSQVKIAIKVRGFTLIELLVAIVIISVLAASLLANFQTSQKRGYDARRQGDIRTTQNAFEQYYAAEGEYPVDDADLPAVFGGGIVPSDPRGGVPYVYTYDYTDPISGGEGYCVCAFLQIAEGNSDDTSCNYGEGPTFEYFCASNLQ